MVRKTCVLGGTFTFMHKGHAALVRECRGFSHVAIGLTSDEYVRKHKIYPSLPYAKRLSALRAFLKKAGLEKRATIEKIENSTDIADEIDADAIIVSEETERVAQLINKKRKARKLEPLEIISIPLVFGQNLKKISCFDIYFGKSDLQGRLLRPLAIQAGTENPTKLAGTRRALSRVFGKGKVLLHGHKEDSRVRSHPFNNETFVGARNRAHAAWKRANGKCDYSLGIESGLFTLFPGTHIDITICCVFDGKRETYGTGMGFVVPEWIAKEIRGSKSDLSRAMAEIAGENDIGRRQGALGWFSDNVFHRADQIEAAVGCAFVPRVAEAKKGIRY